MVTTHYMDEAERCHRLAFMFRGSLLDIGTPEEIVERRFLRIAVVPTSNVVRAVALLEARPEVDEVAPFGDRIRLATRGNTDPIALAQEVLAEPMISTRSKEIPPDVDDDFFAMLHEDPKNGKQA